MKFKKVEISAFRIYDDPKDATFDLTSESGNAAGFVSLYAPNGFGKTSFYDAVEFGVTNSINRFFIRRKELEKLADFQLLQNEIPLIRNSKSEANRPTYVKIITDSDSEPEIYRTFKKHGNQIHDLNFNKGPISHDFQKVILSQEWIAAFLSEQNGEYRYEKFMEIPELASINEYYNKLKQTCSVNETKKNRIKEDIAELEKRIQNINSENLLDVVNNQIQLLIDNFSEQSLIHLSLSSTQEDIKILKDIISNRVVFNNRELSFIQLLDYIDIAKSGNNSIIGLKTYFSKQEVNRRSKKRLLDLKPLLEKFENIKKTEVELNNVKKLQQDHVNENNGVIKVISSFTEYDRVLKVIQEKVETKLQVEESSEEVNKRLSQLHRTEIELRNQFETILKELDELANKKAGIPKMKIDFGLLNDLIQKAENHLSEKKKQVDIKEKEKRALESVIANTRRIINEISGGKYPQISKDENREINGLVRKIEESEQLLTNKNAAITSLNTTIKQQETLNQTISDFINTGLTIVDNRQSSTCPLCEQVYDSYSVLVDKITNNTALDETLKVLLTQKSINEFRIFELTTYIKESREELLEVYREQLDLLSKKNQEQDNLLESLRLNIKDIEIELNVLKQKSAIHFIDLKGLSFEVFEKQIDEEIIKINDARDVINPKLIINKEAIDNANKQLISFENNIALLNKEIGSQFKNENYAFVTEWFKEYFPGKEISKEFLLQRTSSLTDSINLLAIQLEELEEKAINLSKDLSSFNKEALIQEKAELEKLVFENDTKLTAYRYFLKDKLDIDLSQLNESKLSSLIEKKQLEYKTDLERTRSILEEYQKLEKYTENVWPFLQSENAKLKLSNALEELKILEDKVEPIINKERDNARNYLEDRIKNFFYEELINKLYRKIDPHPDFKFVEFKANFDSDNPRLDVFVKNTKNENSLIPNLYFSTAQINILSLSIFLATALNSTDYQCIFIDDPIQSMDSVNILSTIDLLRSIVVNEGKQIVLSTHDENFHNLLKKKIPSNLFESKFLELESFGKVKP